MPIVPFGKYKDKNVLELLADTSYVEWLKKQSWFPHQKQIYNIVVHQTISTSNNSTTPEHNKLQNLFLDKNNQEKLLDKILPNDLTNGINLLLKDEDFIRYFGTLPEYSPTTSVIFEDKFNWDLVMYCKNNIDFTSNLDIEVHDKLKYKEKYDAEHRDIHRNNDSIGNYNINFDKHYNEYKEQLYENIIKKYINNSSTYSYSYTEKNNIRSSCIGASYYSGRDDHLYNAICCELKPVLDDDYPGVLRKLRTQIELTKNDITKFNRYNKKFVLIIGKLTSSNVSKETLQTIFKQHDIKIIYTDEILEPIKNEQKIIINCDQTPIISYDALEENIKLSNNAIYQYTKDGITKTLENVDEPRPKIEKRMNTIHNYFNKKQKLYMSSNL